MLSKKLLSILAIFSRLELNKFRKYLISPFFNENKTLIQLFDLIKSNLESIDFQKTNFSHGLDKQEVWKKLYPNEVYNDAHLRRLSSELLKLVYGFLAYNKLKSDPVKEQLNLLSSLSQMKLEKHFNSSAKQAGSLQEKSKLRDTAFHYNQFLLEHFQYTGTEQSGKKVDSFKNLESADYHLDCYYITNKLKHYCDALSYKNFLSLEANIQLDNSFIKLLKENTFLEEVSVKAYYLIMNMLLYPDQERYFHQVKHLLNTHTDCFTYSELNTLYIYLKNYCIDTKINSGQSEYFIELFNIFKTLLDKGILISEGIIDFQDYKNIITVGLHVKEFDWVESFIQDYTQKLSPDHQENALNYNLAKVYFHKEDYPKVIDQLREVEYQNLVYALGGKLMLLKTYYELEEDLALDSLIDSFRIYLRRNKKISKELKQKYLNVLRFVKKLANLAPSNTVGLQKVKEQIIQCKALATKKWLLEKVEELEKRTTKLSA